MQKKKFGIIIFPGTWSDKDCYYAINNILNNAPNLMLKVSL